jgi:hypothetical protein
VIYLVQRWYLQLDSCCGVQWWRWGSKKKMPRVLTEVDGDEDENTFALRPYGLLLIKLQSDALARKACNALELHMRKFKQSIHVEDDGLHFSPGMDNEDFAIVNRAIMWHDLTESKLHAEAEVDLHEAVEAARRKTWARRREQT